MTVYVSRKDKTVKVKLIKYEEKFKTYLVEYLTGERKGKTISFSSSTMKRWWKEIEDEATEDAAEDAHIVLNTTKETTDKKSVVSKKEAEKKEVKNLLDTVESLIAGRLTYKRNVSMISLYISGDKKKRLAYVYKRKNSIRFYMPNKYYSLISDIIAKYIDRFAGDTNEISFYVKNEDIANVLDIICDKEKDYE